MVRGDPVTYVLDICGVLLLAGGLGYRFGWWVAAVTLGVLLLAASWIRSA